MGEGDRHLERIDRRSLLQYTAVAGGLGMLPAETAANGHSKRAGRNRSSTDSVVLGDFEDGLDGWTTNGGNELEQITEDDVPVGVTSGAHALAVEINGDAFPVIENMQRVRRADFTKHPHLGVHVVAVAESIDADLQLKFRLHHTAEGGNPPNSDGSNSGGGSRSKDVNVAESEWKSVSQLRPQELQWDMSGLSTDVRETAKRLEIVWYLEGHKPDGGPRGRSTGKFDYEGFVVFDEIRLYESAPISETGQRHAKKRDLHREHGMIVERRINEWQDGFEDGTLIFVDGTEVPYSFEVVDENEFEYTVDGETFKIGGGQE